MGLTPTLLGLTISLAVFGLMLVLERRPQQIGRVRMIPYPAVMFVALFCALLFVAHLITLMGGHTGGGR